MKKIFLLALLFSCIPQIKGNISQQPVQKPNFVEVQEANIVNPINVDYGSQLKLEALRSTTSYSLGDYTYDSKYETDHFLLYYNSSVTSYNIATQAGSVFETVRTKYANKGFRYPILENGQSKYRVGLTTDTGSALGVTTYWLGNQTSASYITMYYLADGITNSFKETAAHEYMHAIQNAYNIDMGWFKEACAEWGTAVISDTKENLAWKIKQFIDSGTYLGDDTDAREYGAVLFPLALTKKSNGNTASMVKVLEGFANMSGSFTDQKFVDIVNNAMSQSGYSARYPQILNAMHSYMVKPTQWYSTYGAGTNWSHTSPSQNINITSTNFEGSVTGTIAKSSGKYIKFNVNSGIKGDITYRIVFNNSNGISSRYMTYASSGSDYFYTHPSGTVSSSIPLYGINYSGAGLVLTNPNVSQSISYTIYYSVSPKALKTGQTSYLYFTPEDLYHYSGHGTEWYEFSSSISIGSVPSGSWGTVEVLGYQSNVDFYNDNIYFDEGSGVFYFTFYTDDPDAFGRVRIEYSYIDNVPIQVTTVSATTSYYYFMPNNLEFFSGHGQEWYTLNFTIGVSGVPQDFMYTVTETGFEAQSFISFYSSNIYFDQDDGLFHCSLYSRNTGFGRVRISYTYQRRVLPTA